MVEELITRVFATRNCAHIQHWKTRSYAEHEALGDFYEGAIGILDTLIECYQGNFGPIGEIELSSVKGDVLKCLEADAVWIAEHDDHICEGVDALENILQELTALYLKTIYKLKFLK